MPSSIPAEHAHIQSPTELGKLLGVSRQRAHQMLHRKKTLAREALNCAVRAGQIERPSFCGRCGAGPGVPDAHHPDYNRPLEVEWLCGLCHSQVHPHGYRHRGGKRPNAVLTEEQVRDVRRRVMDGELMREVAARFGISEPNVSAIANRRTWKSVQ